MHIFRIIISIKSVYKIDVKLKVYNKKRNDSLPYQNY